MNLKKGYCTNGYCQYKYDDKLGITKIIYPSGDRAIIRGSPNDMSWTQGVEKVDDFSDSSSESYTEEQPEIIDSLLQDSEYVPENWVFDNDVTQLFFNDFVVRDTSTYNIWGKHTPGPVMNAKMHKEPVNHKFYKDNFSLIMKIANMNLDEHKEYDNDELEKLIFSDNYSEK